MTVLSPFVGVDGAKLKELSVAGPIVQLLHGGGVKVQDKVILV